MAAEDRRWLDVWERRRQRCIQQADELTNREPALPSEALAILAETRALAAASDPAVHAAMDVSSLIERAETLEVRLALLLHGPVSNGLAMLRIAAQEVLSASAAPARPTTGAVLRSRLVRRRLGWILVVTGDGDELVELTAECTRTLIAPAPVDVATTHEEALERLGRRAGFGIVIVNLTLPSAAGAGPHGLSVAAEARRRRHAVLLVTAAGDYLHYWPHLTEAGLTGHDVVVKTRRDFARRLRARVQEIAEPAPLAMSYVEDTGHVVWIGDVEVSRLEAQEALVLRALDDTWQTPSAIADACSADTYLAPRPSAIPPIISTLRRKLATALIDAESAAGQAELIETRRRDGLPTQYRLAPWLRWDYPPEPAGAARALPPVLVIEDDRDWAQWVVDRLEAADWLVTIADSAEAARQRLAGREQPIIVADLALRDPATGLSNPEVGLGLIEDLAATRHGVRVIVLSAFGGRDSLLARLFDAGVRTVDVIDKAAGRDDCSAVLLASLQRAADEAWRGVRRMRESVPGHRVVRRDRRTLEVDGRTVQLSIGQAAVVEELIRRPNQAVRAELIEDACFPGAGARGHRDYNPLNKVHLMISRLRRKIDQAAGSGAGESVIQTAHRGAISAYELHGLVIDESGGDDASGGLAPARAGLSPAVRRIEQLQQEVVDLRREVAALRRELASRGDP